MKHILVAVVIGAGATLCIDLWSMFLRRVFDIRSLDYCLLGRWVLHIPSGRWMHDPIGASPGRRHECATGWLTHYGIGVGLAFAFVSIAPEDWMTSPSFLPAMGFGIATVVMPLFVLQPALGLGVASSRARNPWAARLKSLGTHAVFGLGLFLSALALARLR